MKMTANNDEEEESLMALLDHLRTRVAYYKSKLDKSEKKLEETRTKLAHIRSSKAPRVLAIESGEEEEGCDFQPKPHYQEEEEEEDCKIINTKRKPLLVIPAVSPFPAKKKKIQKKTEWSESGDFRLIEMVSSSSSPCKVSCETSTTMLNSQHKRKLRTLVLSPTNHHQFLTSALDGFVNVWQIQDRGVKS
ncbi:putative transcription factor WD40-like family [Helianthus annuus]|nr:putative transcription factor WD40-like family [Helianthus annuus]